MSGNRMILVAGSLILAAAATLVRADDPVPETISRETTYQTIVDRNPFGLKPQPPPVAAPTEKPKPKGELKLTGITSFGQLKAYFMTSEAGGKNTEYFVLGIDEKRNGLEILGINNNEKSVRVREDGVESVFTFAANGVQPPAAPPPAPGQQPPGAGGFPGLPTHPGSNTPPHNTAAYNAPAAFSNPAGNYNGGTGRSIPSRTTRTANDASVGSTYGFGGSANAAANIPHPQEPPMSTEQQQILMEAQRAVNPGLPPTPGFPPALPGAGSVPQIPGRNFPAVPGR
jgi:hypothetical protein